MKKSTAVLAAIGRETAALRYGLPQLQPVSSGARTVWKGACCGQPVILGHSGIGFFRAASLAEEFIREYPVGVVLSVGFAGGLQGHLAVGDIVLAERVQYERLFPSDGVLLKRSEVLLQELGMSYQTGLLISVDEMVGSQEKKKKIASESQALAMDMESGAIAEVALRSSLPFLSIRAISDQYNETLDPWLPQVITPEGGIHFRQLASSLLARPTRIRSVLRLRSQTALAAKNLGRFLIRFLTTLQDA